MTAVNRGGRRRDPDLSGRVLAAAVDLLAAGGAFTADAVAARAQVGKASLYRRWPALDDLLVDVVGDLGVRDVTHRTVLGSLEEDLVDLVHAAVTGPRAAAEVAVLSRMAWSPALRVAYVAGPVTRLVQAINACEVRARIRRGEPSWPSIIPIVSTVRALLWQTAMDGEQPLRGDVAELVEETLVPALLPSGAVA